MSEPSKNMRISFTDVPKEFPYIRSIGYDDFRTVSEWKFLHTQPQHTFHYVRNGSGELVILDRRYYVNAGDVFYIPPNVPMMYCPSESDPWRYYFFSIYDTMAETIAKLMGFTGDNSVLSVKAPDVITSALDALFASTASNREKFHMAYSTLSLILLNMHAASNNTLSQKKEVFVPERVKEIIELNHSDCNFSIDIIPKLLYISHSHMCKVFKEKFGISPVAYLYDVRMEFAKMKLREYVPPIKELAASVGFSDELYFMKRFKQNTGMTVREYRKYLENNNLLYPPKPEE